MEKPWLIDANALIDDIDGDLTDGIAERKAIEKIENAPTVEAIPIEWLQAKADSWNAELKTACSEDAETIRHIQQKYLGIIEEWRKEK